ncbi:AraC family transcriptional regulator [Lentisphaerota bacterium WC36G]|nr:AraC family transcriptional regulator [Lentisphaerae bacterium WC36]
MKKEMFDNMESLYRLYYWDAQKQFPFTPDLTFENTEHIELIIDGEALFREDNDSEEKAYGRGHIFWHIPGEFTVWKTPKERPYKAWAFIFKTHKSSKRTMPRVGRWKNLEDMEKFIKEIFKAYHSESFDNDILSHYVYSRLCWEVEWTERNEIDDKIPNNLTKIIKWINENYSQQITVKDIALANNISMNQLHNLFRSNLFVTPLNFLHNLQLQKAKEFLAATDLPIKEIASQCGFDNIETFYRVFKKGQKTTPGAYRKSHMREFITKPK